jgi:ribosomal protein S10
MVIAPRCRRTDERFRGPVPLPQPMHAGCSSQELTNDQQLTQRHMMRQFLRDFLAHAG